jgi:hypothetical protein
MKAHAQIPKCGCKALLRSRRHSVIRQRNTANQALYSVDIAIPAAAFKLSASHKLLVSISWYRSSPLPI